MFLEKGAAYYNHHVAFHILFGIFVIAALISIYPTGSFCAGATTQAQAAGRSGTAPIQENSDMVRAKMTLMLLAPLFATWMAHGEF